MRRPPMRGFRSSGSRIPLTGIFIAALASTQLPSGGSAAPGERGLLGIDIHDGAPYAPVWASSEDQAVGNFMTWIDTWDEGFIIQRIWFYHGGDYADSGVPYEVHLVRRIRYGGGEEGFSYQGHYARATTCNYCWEELDTFLWFAIGGSDEESTLGVFICPLGGWISPEPRLWRDHDVDHEHLSALLNLWFSPVPNRGPAGGDRDLYSVDYYFSDYGMGEALLGMEIESDAIVAAEPTSFSAVKSLY
jgi:hypothetical protein